MAVVLFSPHNDDETLFASHLCIAHDPLVVIVLRSARQTGLGVSAETRERETDCAMAELGVTEWTQWPYVDSQPNWDAVLSAMRALDERVKPETVFAPAEEQGGHEDHNAVGRLARSVFGGRVTSYCTYIRGSLRTRTSSEVPFEPEWVALKLRAMACYRSQIALPQTLPWFIDDCLREYLA